jgi:hypothetical protein
MQICGVPFRDELRSKPCTKDFKNPAVAGEPDSAQLQSRQSTSLAKPDATAALVRLQAQPA